MHPIRLEIYKFVSETPGSHLYEIIDNLEIPQGTITWHLRKMSESGLIDTVKIGGRRAFFSKALRGVDTEQAFAMLKSNKAKEIFLYILIYTIDYKQLTKSYFHLLVDYNTRI